VILDLLSEKQLAFKVVDENRSTLIQLFHLFVIIKEKLAVHNALKLNDEITMYSYKSEY
jgi:hypothetical protein